MKSDKSLVKRIIDKIELLSSSPGQLQIKKLKANESLYRVRVSDYRIIFEVLNDVIFINKIGHRKDIYK